MDAEGRIAGTERDQHASAVLQACSVDLKTSGKLDAAAIDGHFFNSACFTSYARRAAVFAGRIRWIEQIGGDQHDPGAHTVLQPAALFRLTHR
jgi:hypothetical protein